ncbi:hypothetical protein FB459_2284 [Yimella lutea]|uniref:Uncharacterized protein n=1 Tax=Yimella lutea TaxID=587872 RepID=A0A542EHG6_9MICO|nr:hypothetical protein [Yimella lutea]TQJ14780.1 hypothetical protein FB459_2284 [Yimella lutea]
MNDSSEQLIAEARGAAWLPVGSTAQVWAGDDCSGFVPAVIVRLLLTRRSPEGEQFFTIAAPKGDDLPTLFLGHSDQRRSGEDGVQELAAQIVGDAQAPVQCVGFVRNVVPTADETYPHPVPHANVPVFRVTNSATPVVEGTWYTVEAARDALHQRHWWPIVEHALEK